MSNDNGGRAFPCETSFGMTMRDYFAAEAMHIIMPAVAAELQRKTYSKEKALELKEAAADACYGMADAMLDARAR